MKENKVSWIILVSALSVACGGAGGSAGSESNGGAGAGPAGIPPTSETLASTVLSSVTLDSGETIEFRAYGADRVGIVDTFRYGQPHAVPANAQTMTLSQVYSSVAPGKTVPAALRDADQRLAAAKGAPAARIPPPPQHDSTRSSPVFYDFNAWFQQNFCSNVVFCGQQTGSYLIGPWTYTTAFTATGGVDGAALSSASLYTYTWDGISAVGAGNTATVAPGWAVWSSFSTSNPTWYFSYLTQASGGVEEDLAEQGDFDNVWSVLGPMDNSVGDIRYYSADGDWAPGYFKYECGGGVDVVAGFSSIGQQSCGLFHCSQEETHAMLCASLPQPLAYGSAYTLQFQTADDRRDTSTGDWAPGWHKAECAPKDAIVGMAEFRNSGTNGHSVEFAQCAPINGNLGATQCQPLVFEQTDNTGFGDDRESTFRGDWDPGYIKGECGPGRYVKGIAKDFDQYATFTENSSGTKVTTILCCSPTTN